MKKRILFFIATLDGGGAERLLLDLVNHMDADKFDVTVQTFYDIGIYRNQLSSNIQYKTIVSLKNNSLRKLKGGILWTCIPPEYVYNKYIKDEYDYQVAFLEGIATKFIACSDINSYLIAWVHSGLYSNFWTKNAYRTFKAQQKAYQNFKEIVCVSKNAKEEFVQRFGNYNSLCVKYNFINRETILSKANEKTDDMPKKYRFRIVTIGRLVPQKGFGRLLAVMKNLIKDGVDCELWIFGKGKCQKKLQKYILNNSLSDYVKLWGFYENPYKYMKQCDLFVCSSISEGYSLVIAEAMVLGLPVLSTYCSGPDELLDYGRYGLLVENSEKGLYEGIKTLYNSPEKLKFYARSSQERVEFFDMNMRIKEIEALFVQEEDK